MAGRAVFRNQSNIYDGAFFNYFCKKTLRYIFDWILNTPLVGIDRKSQSLKVINFTFEMSRKKIAVVFRGEFTTPSKIYDGVFLGK